MYCVVDWENCSIFFFLVLSSLNYVFKFFFLLSLLWSLKFELSFILIFFFFLDDSFNGSDLKFLLDHALTTLPKSKRNVVYRSSQQQMHPPQQQRQQRQRRRVGRNGSSNASRPRMTCHCGRTFTYDSHLKYHKKWECGRRIHCPNYDCKKSFSTVSNLKYHLNHTHQNANDWIHIYKNNYWVFYYFFVYSE